MLLLVIILSSLAVFLLSVLLILNKIIKNNNVHDQNSIHENSLQRRPLEEVRSSDSNIKPNDKLDSLINKIGSLIDSYKAMTQLKEEENKAIFDQLGGLHVNVFSIKETLLQLQDGFKNYENSHPSEDAPNSDSDKNSENNQLDQNINSATGKVRKMVQNINKQARP